MFSLGKLSTYIWYCYFIYQTKEINLKDHPNPNPNPYCNPNPNPYCNLEKMKIA